MALTAYCKKCNREVAPGDICPHCGTKLAKTATHAAWVVQRTPATDWMCWNAVMRWLVPGGLVVLVLGIALEGLSGGIDAVEKLFLGGFPLTLGLMLGTLLLLVLGALILQGRDLMDYVVDSRGVHVTRYLPNPTPLKLLARGKSPRMMDQVNPEADSPVLRLEDRSLSWREVARVQLWPEKCYVLFYAPTWWLRIPVRCTPFSWEDVLSFVQEKLGKKKTVDLPEHLRIPTEKKAAAPRAQIPAPRRVEEIPADAAPQENMQETFDAAPEEAVPWWEETSDSAEPNQQTQEE